MSSGNSDFRVGQATGDAVATVQGAVEMLGGAGGEAGGVALDATGVGAIAGVPLNVASAGVILHGTAVAGVGLKNLVGAALDPQNNITERRANDFSSSFRALINSELVNAAELIVQAFIAPFRTSCQSSHPGLRPILFLALSSSPALRGEPQTTAKGPIEATVCEIVQHANRFVGKRVRFRAGLVSDGFEHTVLVDRKCKLGIIPRIPDRLARNEDIQALERALDSGAPGPVDKKIAATFTGSFTLQSRKRVLEIEGVSEIGGQSFREGQA